MSHANVAQPGRRDGRTHVALEVRLSLGEADLVRYWLDRIGRQVERGVATYPVRSHDPYESVAALRKVHTRLTEVLS